MNKYNPELVKDPGQAAADYVDDLILEKMIEIAKTNNMGVNYQALGSNLCGFERGYQSDEQMFKAGVASAEAAVRRLRESYYETIKEQIDEQETK